MAESQDYDSESESEFSVHAKEDPANNHVGAAIQLITNYGEVNSSNALKINRGYQNALIELKTKLEVMLDQCRLKYQENEQKLKVLREETTQSRKKEGESAKNYAYYLCGAPYFKSKLLQPCPNNPDYTTRKRRFEECFPLDLKVSNHLWSFHDKKDLVEGIRLQIINHIQKHNGYCIGSIRGTSGAGRRDQTKQINEIRRSNLDLSAKSFEELNELASSLEKYNGKPFVIDWSNVSYAALCSRHSELQCEAMWNNYLRPELNRDAWTEDEEQWLLDVALKHQCQDWVAIAKELENRSPYQCFVQFQNKFSEKAQIKVKTRWSTKEDELLIKMVELHSRGSNIAWNKVAENVAGRNKFQCYNRYTFTLKPGIKKYRFTPEEDCKIMAYVQVHGTDFGNMPTDLLPGRTSQQVRGRYQNALKRVNECNIWTVAEDKHLMDFVAANGTGNWSQLANQLTTHTRLSCRTRYLTLTNYLKNNPKAELKDAPRKHRGSMVTVDQDNWAEKLAELENAEEVEPDVTEQTKKPKRESITKTDIYLQDYFKYAYKFQYDLNGPDVQCSDVDTSRSLLTSKTLDVKLIHITTSEKSTNSEIHRLNKLLAVETIVSQQKTNESNTLLPVNWNNTIGLRGVSLLCTTQESSNLPSTDTKNEAYAILRKRFRQLFYWPAVLSQTKIESRPISPELEQREIAEEQLEAEGTQPEAKEEPSVSKTIQETGEKQVAKVEQPVVKGELPRDEENDCLADEEQPKAEEINSSPVKQENAVDFLHRMFGESKDFFKSGTATDEEEDDEPFFTIGLDSCKREATESEKSKPSKKLRKL